MLQNKLRLNLHAQFGGVRHRGATLSLGVIASHSAPSLGASAVDSTCTSSVDIAALAPRLGVIMPFFAFKSIVMYVSALKT